ncbi:hypothetical protein Ahy_A01g004883 isoform C [Arachis hypogaea]|uniref:Uncharacterized protein n=1 Tax=Arachis hypogaea TaxID=3818 RepID=A0A445EXG3_ARAHY|nr:hypothetical protein Ahy_A01g004883 isoform C [Arachis hypogaea]
MFFGLRKREEREGEVKLSPSKSGQVDDLPYLWQQQRIKSWCILYIQAFFYTSLYKSFILMHFEPLLRVFSAPSSSSCCTFFFLFLFFFFFTFISCLLFLLLHLRAFFSVFFLRYSRLPLFFDIKL